MKLTRTQFDARVKIGTGPDRPVILSLGIMSFKSTADEARRLALALWDAAENVQPSTQSDPDTTTGATHQAAP